MLGYGSADLNRIVIPIDAGRHAPRGFGAHFYHTELIRIRSLRDKWVSARTALNDRFPEPSASGLGHGTKPLAR
jgi:hypothetical protein